jgi:hypothetical protein
MSEEENIRRREVERFDDGRQTVRSYAADERITRMETLDADGRVLVAIDYLYDDAGVNVERIVRDAAGNVLRRMQFDADGQELSAGTKASSGDVRWASMDGTDEGLDPKGQERISK